jgi:hypothetical protein
MAQSPKRAKRRAALSPREVGAERRRFAKQREVELTRRLREYEAALRVPKRVAAKRGRAGAAGPKRALAPAKKPPPLQILAEGDSWFDYPALPDGGIISRLADRLGVPILNLAKAGDEVRFMLGVEERKELRKHLVKGGPAGAPWDVLLFSGGGNDIVDNPMALCVREYEKSKPPGQLLHQPRFDAALALVRAGYEDLIALRDEHSPTTQLLFHAYDFALPDGRGVCFFGPWLKPTFKLRGFPAFDPSSAAALVVREMLQQFAAMLQSLVRPGVTFLNGQQTLPNTTKSWHNELHPSSAGFDAFARLFHDELRQLFPGRVP